MRLKTFSSVGIVLSRKNYGEVDRIITIFSRDYGKIKLLAKGVRKPISKKRGHIEVFSKLKFSSTRGKSIDLITEAELIDSYETLRVDLKKTAVAYYLCEVVDRVTRELEKNESIFENLAHYLSKLGQTEKLRNLRSEFVRKTLIVLGFLPEGENVRDVDKALAEVTEWEISSARVGKQMLT